MSGAGTSGVIRSVLIPLLTPTILYAWIWIALLAYRELTLPVILSSASNQPLSVVVWSLVAGSSYGQASAVATIMLAIMLPILVRLLDRCAPHRPCRTKLRECDRNDPR